MVAPSARRAQEQGASTISAEVAERRRRRRADVARSATTAQVATPPWAGPVDLHVHEVTAQDFLAAAGANFKGLAVAAGTALVTAAALELTFGLRMPGPRTGQPPPPPVWIATPLLGGAVETAALASLCLLTCRSPPMSRGGRQGSRGSGEASAGSLPPGR
ncbi:hypothetical protein ABPG75_001923 [Micractinium tetrahymenae]